MSINFRERPGKNFMKICFEALQLSHADKQSGIDGHFLKLPVKEPKLDRSCTQKDTVMFTK
jgi:hypothetical protein